MNNTIPPITDPLGKYWDQPSLASILIDDTHAVLTDPDWKSLHEYSCSIPDGKYPGKIWKAIRGGEGFLVWYSLSRQEGFLDINYRAALIV